MKTLVIFCPENGQNSHKTFRDILVLDKRLRIIYYRENLSAYKLWAFKFKVKKLIKNAHILLTDFSKKIAKNPIYRSGILLATHHISGIVNIVSKNSPITVFSCNSSDIYTLSDLIMVHKNIKFLTYDTLIEEFNEVLLSEFGISGGCVSGCDLSDETVIIMPGGEIFSPEGAKKIINLSKTHITFKCINPESISYIIPKPLKGIPPFVRKGDMMETIFCFLGMNFSYTKPNSVILNKRNGII